MHLNCSDQPTTYHNPNSSNFRVQAAMPIEGQLIIRIAAEHGPVQWQATRGLVFLLVATQLAREAIMEIGLGIVDGTSCPSSSRPHGFCFDVSIPLPQREHPSRRQAQPHTLHVMCRQGSTRIGSSM